MRRAAIVIGLLLALTVGLTPVTAGPTPALVGQTAVDADRVVLDVMVQSGGDAAWLIEHRVRLETDNQTAAFEDVATDIRRNKSDYATQFRAQMAPTVASASNATGREMTLENVSVSAEQRALPQTYGVVSYRFAWSNFAAVSDKRLNVGAAIAGLFLDSDTVLRVSFPDGYNVSAVEPTPDEASASGVVWRGPREFGAAEPSLTLAPAAGESADGSGVAGGSIWVWAALLGLLAVGAYLLWRRRGGTPAPTAHSEGSESAATTATEDAGDAEPAGEPDRPPMELLSNEEQVQRVLTDNGGRLKQKELAGELDWTDAKTSQVITDMREAGEVETFRLGRENVVTFPDEGLGEDIGPD
jgi:uncharacterized membrane protein